MAGAALLVVACTGGPQAPASTPAAGVDEQRLRLLGGVPPAEAERGLYLVDLKAAGEQSPGSRVGPFLGTVLDQAQLLVETTAPPLTLLGGMDDEIETPSHALRVDDVLVFAEPDPAQAAADLLADGAAPGPELTAAAASQAPVVWVGPTPAPNAEGSTLIELGADSVTFSVTPSDAVDVAVAHARQELAAGAPPGSPGKPWTSVLAEADVSVDGPQVIIRARPLDLPGPFLRSLIDQQQLTFLPG